MRFKYRLEVRILEDASHQISSFYFFELMIMNSLAFNKKERNFNSMSGQCRQ